MTHYFSTQKLPYNGQNWPFFFDELKNYNFAQFRGSTLFAAYNQKYIFIFKIFICVCKTQIIYTTYFVFDLNLNLLKYFFVHSYVTNQFVYFYNLPLEYTVDSWNKTNQWIEQTDKVFNLLALITRLPLYINGISRFNIFLKCVYYTFLCTKQNECST